MKKTIRKGLLVLFTAVFLLSSLFLMLRLLDQGAGNHSYEDAEQIAQGTDYRNRTAYAPEIRETMPQPQVTETREAVWIPEIVTDDPIAEEMYSIDLRALREENPDVVGWIRIPDTNIHYPLMQGQDNDYYLNNTWNRQNNSMGSIFLECGNRADLTDYNTIVYGHNMSTGKMFGQLHRYAEKAFWEAHPYVYILCDAGVLRYEIFAAYRTEVDSVVYGLSYREEKTKAAFLLHALENTKIDTGILPEKTDRILTLSTCSGAGYDTRWVVHARLKMVKAA